LIAPGVVEMIGKKKRRRGKKDEASTSMPASGVHAPKQRKRRTQRESPQAPGACTLLFLI
jgi:hypothetical protein